MPLVLRQSQQPLGTLGIFRIELGLIAISPFAHAKGLGRQPDAQTTSLDRPSGHLASARWTHGFLRGLPRPPTVLLLTHLHPGRQRHVHAAVLAATFIKRRRTDPVLSAQIRNRPACLGPLERREDRAVRKPLSLHVELPPTRTLYF